MTDDHLKDALLAILLARGPLDYATLAIEQDPWPLLKALGALMSGPNLLVTERVRLSQIWDRLERRYPFVTQCGRPVEAEGDLS